MLGFVSVFGAIVAIGAQVAATQAATVTSALGANVNSAVTGTVGNVTGSANGNTNANATATGSVNTNVSVGVGLQAELNSGTVTTSSDDAVVNLQGGTALLIESTSDLQAYGNLVVAARPVVKNVSMKSDDSVVIQYSQPAKFLWIFPTTLTGEVDVDATGNAMVHLPWYAFLYSADTASVQSTATAAVSQSGANFNDQANTTADLQDKARIVNAVSAALQAQADATANVNSNTDVNADTNTSANAGAY
jgi:hypothetical protein